MRTPVAAGTGGVGFGSSRAPAVHEMGGRGRAACDEGLRRRGGATRVAVCAGRCVNEGAAAVKEAGWLTILQLPHCDAQRGQRGGEGRGKKGEKDGA